MGPLYSLAFVGALSPLWASELAADWQIMDEPPGAWMRLEVKDGELKPFWAHAHASQCGPGVEHALARLFELTLRGVEKEAQGTLSNFESRALPYALEVDGRGRRVLKIARILDGKPASVAWMYGVDSKIKVFPPEPGMWDLREEPLGQWGEIVFKDEEGRGRSLWLHYREGDFRLPGAFRFYRLYSVRKLGMEPHGKKATLSYYQSEATPYALEGGADGRIVVTDSKDLGAPGAFAPMVLIGGAIKLFPPPAAAKDPKREEAIKKTAERVDELSKGSRSLGGEPKDPAVEAGEKEGASKGGSAAAQDPPVGPERVRPPSEPKREKKAPPLPEP